MGLKAGAGARASQMLILRIVSVIGVTVHLVWALTETEKELLATATDNTDILLLDCDEGEIWKEFRREHPMQCDVPLVMALLQIWKGMDFAAASEHLGGAEIDSINMQLGGIPGSAEEKVWSMTHMFSMSDDHAARWLRQVKVLHSQALTVAQSAGIDSETGVWLPDTNPVAYECPHKEFGPYAALVLGGTLLRCMRHLSREVGHEWIADTLRKIRLDFLGLFDVTLDFPAHTTDFLESTTWNTSSFDLAAIFISSDPDFGGVEFASFDEYASARPSPAPYLPVWQADFPVAARWVGDIKVQAHVSEELMSRQMGDDRRPLSIAIFNLHDAGAWDELQSLLAALSSLVPNLAEELVSVHWFFTRVHALKHCPEGAEILKSVSVGWTELREEFSRAQRGETDLDDFRHWVANIWRRAPLLHAADIVLCGEPFMLCPFLDEEARRPMIGRFNMALLNEFYFGPDDMERWWGHFYRLVDAGRVLFSVASRTTAEQVYYQTGVRVPWVPYLALQLRNRKRRQAAAENRLEHRSQEVLFFSNNRPALLAFRDVLRLFFYGRLRDFGSLRIRDMNRAGGQVVCREEMAGFRAAVLMPHAPNAIRIVDLYALGVVLFVPGEPLIHKYIFNNRGFGGHAAPHSWRGTASHEERARRRAAGANDAGAPSLPPPAGHPPISVFEHLHDWSLHKGLDARRYWLQYSEYVTFKGLQRFTSVTGLLAGLLALDEDAAAKVRVEMEDYHGRLCNEALGWWRAALTPSLVGTA